jgi:hypothetical protein
MIFSTAAVIVPSLLAASALAAAQGLDSNIATCAAENSNSNAEAARIVEIELNENFQDGEKGPVIVIIKARLPSDSETPLVADGRSSCWMLCAKFTDPFPDDDFGKPPQHGSDADVCQNLFNMNCAEVFRMTGSIDYGYVNEGYGSLPSTSTYTSCGRDVPIGPAVNGSVTLGRDTVVSAGPISDREGLESILASYIRRILQWVENSRSTTIPLDLPRPQ